MSAPPPLLDSSFNYKNLAYQPLIIPINFITINANMLHHIYYSIWLLLRLLTGLYELLRLLLLQLQSVYHKSYDLLNQAEKSQETQHEFAFLQRCKLELSKIPRHLSIIVGPKECEMGAEQFIRIALYALSMDIDCISFYDTRNATEPEEQATQKQKAVAFQDICPPKFVSVTEMQKNRCRWTLSGTNLMQNGQVNGKLNGVANGVTSNGGVPSHHKQATAEKSIEVVMLSAKDGRPLLAEVCRDLFQRRQTSDVQNLLTDRTLLMERINTELIRKLNKLPDPELSIIFNRHTCTFGLLPWQTRFTEFYTIEPGRHFNVETFARVLYKFSRCEQRWGK